MNGLQSFLDGAAMMFPLDGEATTSIFMGSRGRPVNIWYWKAGNQVQNLFAEGFGTFTRASIQDVTGKGVYANGTWMVVLSRSLKTTERRARS